MCIILCVIVQDCYVVIQKTTQVMMDRLRQILTVDAVSSHIPYTNIEAVLLGIYHSV